MPATLKYLTDKRDEIDTLLAKWPNDGLYYSVEFVDIDTKIRKCLVRFEDGTEHWIPVRDLHLQLPKHEEDDSDNPATDDIVCCICDNDVSESPNEIVLCDTCEQGFHQKCHSPVIENLALSPDDWSCSTCHYILNQSSPGDNKPVTTSDNKPVVVNTSVATIVKVKKTKSIEEVIGSLRKQSIEQTKETSKQKEEKEIKKEDDNKKEDTTKDDGASIRKDSDKTSNNKNPKDKAKSKVDKVTVDVKKQKVNTVEKAKTAKKEKVKKENVIIKKDTQANATKRTKAREANQAKKQRSEPQEQSDTSCETVEDWERTLPAPMTNNPFADE